MEFYIKEAADKSATLITREGHRLFTFKDVQSALTACAKWYGIGTDQVIPYVHPGRRPRQFLRSQDQSAA